MLNPKLDSSDIVTSTSNWRFHLPVRSSKVILESMIAEGKKQKRQDKIDPAFSLLQLYIPFIS